MATLQSQLESAALSRQCKLDLLNHVEQLDLQSSLLPKAAPTVVDDHLPCAVTSFTESRRRKAVDPHYSAAAKAQFESEKELQQQAMLGASTTLKATNSVYSKQYKTTFRGQPKNRDPFRDSRSREQLSGKDEDFVCRYADALTHTSVERPPHTDAASVEATEAYKKAFRAYKGRDPTAKELEEVGRLYFAFDENGNVGVVQKTHSCYPHSHVTLYTQRPCQCANQVYKAEVPAVRGARDRFPGPVPQWSSTKATDTMVAGGMHVPGHHETASMKRSTMDTLVGSK